MIGGRFLTGYTGPELAANRSRTADPYVLRTPVHRTPPSKENCMSEDKNPEPADNETETESEEVEVVAHGEDDDEELAACIVNHAVSL